MAPQITTPPKPLAPRQTGNPNDPYGLSSLQELLSSIYDPALYSSLYDPGAYSSILAQYSSLYGPGNTNYNAYYSSILADYSSILNNPSFTYGIPTSTRPGRTATNTPAPKTNASTSPTSTSTSSSAFNGPNEQPKGGLSTGAKIGIGVGVPLAVGLLVGIGIFLWCAGKNKGKKTGTTVVVPPQQQYQPPQQQIYAPNPQGYIQGFQQQSPLPQYVPPAGDAYGGYVKAPHHGVAELEQEYHFARPGAVEMDGGITQPPAQHKGK